jgi:hypothetical protein
MDLLLLILIIILLCGAGWGWQGGTVAWNNPVGIILFVILILLLLGLFGPWLPHRYW